MGYELYEGSVYRPPSEWDSLIIQSTIGCSHNKCSFCSMYKDKEFRIKPLEQVKQDILYAARVYGNRKKIFFADGDALVRKTSEQVALFNFVREVMPSCERISLYGSPSSILIKSQDELYELKKAGLYMVYMGVESGSDDILFMINKGVTASQILKAGEKIKKSGIKLSVTAIAGLGGHDGLMDHSIETSRILSAIKPDYIGVLTLMLEEGTKLKEEYDGGRFRICDTRDILEELKIIIANVDSEGSIFRANHASNYINLKGTLNKDKEILLNTVNLAICGEIDLKSEIYRGL